MSSSRNFLEFVEKTIYDKCNSQKWCKQYIPPQLKEKYSPKPLPKADDCYSQCQKIFKKRETQNNENYRQILIERQQSAIQECKKNILKAVLDGETSTTCSSINYNKDKDWQLWEQFKNHTPQSCIMVRQLGEEFAQELQEKGYKVKQSDQRNLTHISWNKVEK